MEALLDLEKRFATLRDRLADVDIARDWWLTLSDFTMNE